LDKTPKVWATELQINKWDHIKLKVCSAKEIINRVKRQLTDKEKKSASYMSDKRVNIQNI
jgi:hypothetical protein